MSECNRSITMDSPYSIHQYTLPAWTLPCLINEDYSGISDSEIMCLEEFCHRLDLEYGSYHFGGYTEEEFKTRNDLPHPYGQLGGQCVEIDLIYKTKD